MKIRPLTLLQRGVIQRLRALGRHQLADAAHDAWRKGEPCAAPIEVGNEELRTDFYKANAQTLQGD